MYLARKHINGKTHYSIRESYKNNGCFKSRDLFDLGADPTRYIVYPGGSSFEEALSVMGIAKEDMPSMTIQTLTRQYRKMAKTYHPDKGGKHEKFIKLNQAYSDLLRAVKSRSGRQKFTTRHGSAG